MNTELRRRENLWVPTSYDLVSLEDDEACHKRKVPVCHRPPGNPSNSKTIYVGEPAVRAHLAHGDYEGHCERD